MPKSPTPVILVIDDDAAVRQSLKFALEQEGLEAHLYDSGEHLLGERDLPQSGCLVVDYVMPGMDGITLVERLRQRHVCLPAILSQPKARRRSWSVPCAPASSRFWRSLLRTVPCLTASVALWRPPHNLAQCTGKTSVEPLRESI